VKPIKNLALILFLAVITASCGSGKTSQEAPLPPTIKTEKIAAVTETGKIRVSGVITPQDNPSQVSFLVSGRVIISVYREGDYVKKGQVLAKIDPEDYSHNLAQAEAQVNIAKAAYDKAMLPARREQLEQAKIGYERAADEYRRMKMLYDRKSLAPNNFEKYKAAYESAAQKYEMAKQGAQPQDKAQAKAAYEQALAVRDTARKKLGDTVLRAPVNGFISKRLCEPGQTVASGHPVFEIVGLDPVEVNAGIPETDIGNVSIGQTAQVTLPALGGKIFTGTVRVINVSADPVTRSFMTRITVQNPDHVIRIGMVTEAVIDTGQAEKMITVPLNSVTRDFQGATVVYVYLPDKNRVYARQVEVSSVTETRAVIDSGLREGELIVTAGQDRLSDGMTVQTADQRK